MSKKEIPYLVPPSLVNFGFFSAVAAKLQALYCIRASLDRTFAPAQWAIFLGACFVAGATLPWFFISQRSTISKGEGSPAFGNTYEAMSPTVKYAFLGTLTTAAATALIGFLSANRVTQNTAFSILYLCAALVLEFMSWQWNVSWQDEEFRRKFNRFLKKH